MWVEYMRVGSLECPLFTDAGNGERARTFRAPKHENMQEILHISLLGIGTDAQSGEKHPMFRNTGQAIGANCGGRRPLPQASSLPRTTTGGRRPEVANRLV